MTLRPVEVDVSMMPPAILRRHLVEQCLRGVDTPTHDIERMLAEEAYRSLASFVQQCWSVLEPGRKLEWNWHFDLICSTLERVTSGELRDVLICVPPGTAKSFFVSVFWPAWWWLREPGKRFLTLSSADGIATRDSRRMREICKSPWYRRLVAEQVRRGRIDEWHFARDQDEKVRFENTARGARYAFSTGGSITGERGDGLIIDDPHQVKDVLGSTEQVAAALGKAHDKVDVVLPDRVIDKRTAWRVTIMQRVHQDDVAGRQINDPAIYKLILPMRAYPADHPWRHPDDPREEGELLDPVVLPEDKVNKSAAQLERQAPGQSRAQHQQEPIAAGGGTFQRAWMVHRYSFDPQRPPKPFDEIVITVDATFGSKTKAASFVSIQVFGRWGWTAHHLLAEVHRKLSYVEMKSTLRDLTKIWRGPVVIEVKALGPALVEELARDVPGVVAFSPDAYGGKEARAQAASSWWAAGNFWLPEADKAPWIVDWINEVAAFPGTTVRDRVDSMSQYFLWCQERRSTTDMKQFTAALRGAFGR